MDEGNDFGFAVSCLRVCVTWVVLLASRVWGM